MKIKFPGGWVGGWLVGDCQNKANSAQLGLAGAWAVLGNKNFATNYRYTLQRRRRIFLENLTKEPPSETEKEIFLNRKKNNIIENNEPPQRSRRRIFHLFFF